VTLELGLFALVIALAVAIPVGVLSAIRQDGWADYLFAGVQHLDAVDPAFWLALLIILIPTVWFPSWSGAPPYVGLSDSPLQHLRIMLIPAFCLGAGLSGRRCAWCGR